MAGNSILLAALSVLSACQQSYFAMQVGKARSKYKVTPPSVSGSPDFERIFRAQQNCVEFYPIFIITLWMAGWYFNQVFATCLGLVYIYSRHQYFWGYAEAAKKRNATDGGGSQQTHKVAREESHQLIAQDTAGCENGLYKVKRKKICHFQETTQR
uniref:Microsomal glutathione S-transferase 2 n=1 Tax=Bos indicus x Bos taurus TaxID=30522 RepID=A0A4W2C1D0_BOBOX